MYYLVGCILRGVLASLCIWDLSLLLFEVLLDEERGVLEDDEFEDAVLLLAEEVLTFDEERGEFEEELFDIVLLLEV